MNDILPSALYIDLYNIGPGKSKKACDAQRVRCI